MSAYGRASVSTATLVGVQAVPVEVQVDIASGLPVFTVVGLGDTAVLEARERVRSAIRAQGFKFPNARVIVNLAPAPVRKHGTGFDLPIAAAILAATGQIEPECLDDAVLVGELSLDGRVVPVPGVLAHALGALRQERRLVGPPDSAGTVSLLGDLTYHAVASLSDLPGGPVMQDVGREPVRPGRGHVHDLSDVAGHAVAKRALEIAAAGGHNLLLVGPPGSGKTMLARRLPGLLPPLEERERLEAALVHSVAGLDERLVLGGTRPFRAPHHSASIAGLIGGGTPPRPGEVSLSHAGVLFLDETPQFGVAALQTLRQPLEDGSVVLVRAEGRVTFPARFALVAAANPCPCGYFGDPHRRCECTDTVVKRYAGRIGGPLLDRIDLHLRVERIDPSQILSTSQGEGTATAAARVECAREFARSKGRDPSACLQGRELLTVCRLTRDASDRLALVARTKHLSGRAVTRMLRVARTIADLTCLDRVQTEHINEALGYRELGGA